MSLELLRSLRLFGMIPLFDLLLGAAPLAYAFQWSGAVEPWRAIFLTLAASVAIHELAGTPTPFSDAVVRGHGFNAQRRLLLLMTLAGLITW
jgi:hypothetical protein